MTREGNKNGEIRSDVRESFVYGVWDPRLCMLLCSQPLGGDHAGKCTWLSDGMNVTPCDVLWWVWYVKA